MDAVVPRFPFLRLPEDVQMKTFGQMPMMEILNFSLSSKQTKSTARKLKLKIHGIDVHINEQIGITVAGYQRFVLTFRGLEDIAPKAEFCWHVFSQFIPNPGFQFEHWLNHLLYIFNQSRIRIIVFDRVPCIQDLLSFRRTFDKFQTLWIYPRCPDHVAKEVLTKFRPENKLIIHKNVPDIDNSITSNLDKIHMKTILELDKLLIMNSRFIDMFTQNISSRDINRFLKLWIAGSNGNLEMLFIQSENPTDSEINQVLKGISHENVADDVERQYPDWRNKALNWIVKGGFDIRRRGDGAIATITYVENRLNFSLSSKQTKSTVRKLKLKIYGIDVHINEQIGINAAGRQGIVLTFRGLEDMSPKAEFRWRVPSQFISNPGFRFEQWINHLLYIFNQSEIRNLVFGGVPCIQRLLNFRRTFDKFQTLWIYARCPDHVAKEAVIKFQPEKKLVIDKHVPDIDNYIISNLDKIHMKTTLELDELLIMNSKSIAIFTPKISCRDMNQFLKLWIAGSNRNLAMLFIQSENPTDLEINQVLKGISHEKVSDDVRRKFPDPRNKKVRWIVNGGFDIKRGRDGAIATVDYVGDRNFKMFVWRS
ncbi:hypothetical protein B9Z55_011778 [Caenorhabditis nigoni]|uniref:F-box domain-containing protein n=2 Tax=Caenorhabditis nigoni TaxID=1611254 RepID=A0A2G5ULJ4_9PELO|nr:hypothetical protein B9Z55_011778 [Caenorhabditis nigoni]